MEEPIKLLLIEDSESDAALIALALQQHGLKFVLERVEDGPSLERALAQRTFDAVLSDWSLPGFSGSAALAMVRGRNPDLPFIIVSGTLGEEAAVDAMRAGAHDYVFKDRLARLAPALERELRDSKLRKERRRSDEALRNSEARLGALFQRSPFPKWLCDLQTARFIEVNETALRFYGYSRDEFLGMTLPDIRPAEDLPRMQQALARMAVGHVRLGIGHHLKKDGTQVEVDLSGEVFLLAGRRTALVVVQDLSEQRRGEEAQARLTNELEQELAERHRAEDALYESEVRFSRLAESGIIGIAITDVLGNLHDANDAFLHMLGYTRDDLIAKRVNWADATPAEWRHTDELAVEQLQRQGFASPWEKDLIRKDGTRIQVLVGVAMLDPPNCIAFQVDLTGRKQAEAALGEREKIAALTADVGVALAQGDTLRDTLDRCTEAIVRQLDAALARIWIIGPAPGALELQSSAGAAPVPDENGQPVGQAEIRVIAEERWPHRTNEVLSDPRMAGYQWTRREGMVAFAGHPLVVGGELVGVMALFARRQLSDAAFKGLGAIADALAVGIRRKLVERAQEGLQAQLRQSQKMEAIGQLAGGVAHDFNNLLSVILTYSALLAEDLKPDDPLRSDLGEIHLAAERAADLTRQLLAFSRRQVLQPRIVDLNQVVAGVEKMLRRVVGEDLELVAQLSPTPATVKVDPGQMEQVLMNLAVNARDAMPDGGKLTLEISHVELDRAYAAEHAGVTPGLHVLLAVADTGQGMDEATQARVFEPFFTTKEVGKGTGLGLSTVFGIVRQSGGTIALSSAPGAGATFRIYLPAVEADKSEAPDAAAVAAEVGGGWETVLVVEDDALVRKVVRSVLQRGGYRVIQASGGGEALLICEKHPGIIHLLLTDVVMPGMHGVELAKRLLALRPSLKILFMSGYTGDTMIRQGVEESGAELLLKPITSAPLLKKVRQVLDAPSGPPSSRA